MNFFDIAGVMGRGEPNLQRYIQCSPVANFRPWSSALMAERLGGSYRRTLQLEGITCLLTLTYLWAMPQIIAASGTWAKFSLV